MVFMDMQKQENGMMQGIMHFKYLQVERWCLPNLEKRQRAGCQNHLGVSGTTDVTRFV